MPPIISALIATGTWVGTAAGADAPPKGAEIGKPAPELTGLKWLTDAGRPADTRGKVVLVRWWTTGCSLCSATAPALNEFHEKYAKDGLVVVGAFHPKPRPRAVDDADVVRGAERLGFKFPIAVDADWTVLKRWWLDGGERRFTSVSILVGRSGKVVHVHPGGEYFASDDPAHSARDADHRKMKAAIEAALKAEK